MNLTLNQIEILPGEYEKEKYINDFILPLSGIIQIFETIGDY